MASEDFTKIENLAFFVTSPLIGYLDEQLKHVQKAIAIVNRSKRKITATRMKYYSEKSESAYVQLCLFTRKTETEHFPQVLWLTTIWMNLCVWWMIFLMFLRELYLHGNFVKSCCWTLSLNNVLNMWNQNELEHRREKESLFQTKNRNGTSSGNVIILITKLILKTLIGQLFKCNS